MFDRSAAFDHAQPGPAQPSVLDRRIDLSRLSGETLAWVAVFSVAAVLRLIERTTWPLAPDEARLAADALHLLQGGDLSTAAAAHPLTTGLTALALFFFGSTDGVVRLVPLAAGLGAILLLAGLRSWFGRGPMLGAAVVVALSPTLTFASRSLAAGGLLVLGSLFLLWALLRHDEKPGIASAVMVGVAIGLLLLVGPLGWVATLLVLAVALRIAGGMTLRRGNLLPALAGLLATVLLVSTALFTRPAGFSGFLTGSLGDLWGDHLATLGSQWYLVPVNLVVDDPLALLAGIWGAWIVLRRPGALPGGTDRAARALVLWAAAGTVAAMLLGGKGPEIYVLAVLPFALLAGAGIAAVFATIDWPEVSRPRTIAFLVAAFLTVAAVASALGLLTGGPGADTLQWVVTLLVLVVLILIPLAVFTVWLAQALVQPPAPLLGMIGIAFLALLTLHSSVLLGATNIDRPGEPLSFGQTTPDVTLLVGRLQRLSRDVTTFDQSVQDPTGGHGLTITLDESIAQPFAWYFRDFPDLRVIPTGQAGATGAMPQVVIARPDHAAALVPPDQGYVAHDYGLRVAAPAAFRNPDWPAFFGDLINPHQWRQFAAYMVDRQVTTSVQPATFTLALRSDLAQRVYGAPAP